MGVTSTMRYRCLILDHDDTAVDGTRLVHHPAHLRAMEVLRPGTEPVDLDTWFVKNFDPGILSYLVGELGFSDREMAVENESSDVVENGMAVGVRRFDLISVRDETAVLLVRLPMEFGADADPVVAEIMAELREQEPDRLTPLEALQRVTDWRRRLG